MSSHRSRNTALLSLLILFCLFVAVAPVHAQETMQAKQGSPPDRIDILVKPPEVSPADARDCQAQMDAALISGQIVVCREKSGPSPYTYSSKKDALDRYAAATAFRDAPATPDPCGPNCGIFTGKPTMSGVCGIGLNPCPPPPAHFIDVSALPKAPPGSDADRIAHGLPPLGQNDDGATRRFITQEREKALGLPDPASIRRKAEAAAPASSPANGVNPAGSAEPAEQR